MRTDLTDITIVLDRSGSMSSVREDTIGGFNEFLKKQRAAAGDANVSLVQFDNVVETVYSQRPIKEAPELTQETFQPRASTSLYEAICKTIDATGARLAATPEKERAGLVIFVILTDGHENSSPVPFDMQAVNDRITRQRDVYKWQFVFLGANQDAIAAARPLGIPTANALTFAASGQGMRKGLGGLGAKMAATRSAYAASGGDVLVAAAGLAYTPAERAEQEEEIRKSQR